MGLITKEYLAGLFDGEGSVGLYKNGGRWYIRVSVSNSVPAPLFLIKEVYGGSIIRYKQVDHKFVMYRWQAVCVSADSFLKDIAPYVIIKKEQVETAIEYRDKFKKNNGKHLSSEETILREWYADRLKTLKLGEI